MRTSTSSPSRRRTPLQGRTGEEEADIGLGFQGPHGQMGVAGPQDQVGRALHPKPVLQNPAHVYLREDAEALLLEEGLEAGPHLGDGAPKPLLQGEAFHGYPPSVFYREVQESSRFIRS
jgi:hypothetical protein